MLAGDIQPQAAGGVELGAHAYFVVAWGVRFGMVHHLVQQESLRVFDPPTLRQTGSLFSAVNLHKTEKRWAAMPQGTQTTATHLQRHTMFHS